MSTIPIPQGATIADASAAASVAIPESAIVESAPGKGVTTDSMDADYQFKHPALTDDEMKQLKQANLDRPLYRKILGLPAASPLEEKDREHQTESAKNSSYVSEQLTDKAKGAAVVASAPAVAASTVPLAGEAGATLGAVGPTAARVIGTGVSIIKSPLGKYVVAPTVGAGLAHLGWNLAGKWLKGLIE